eukprot:365856-Chlamydomonas_euryale.AAC.23
MDASVPSICVCVTAEVSASLMMAPLQRAPMQQPPSWACNGVAKKLGEGRRQAYPWAALRRVLTLSGPRAREGHKLQRTMA